jgi:prepilin-type N-terminal cleavage/methylation domain-containing protein/prepilin-type processing-associated H-X9-DG protein
MIIAIRPEQPHPLTSRFRRRGFTLIEILVVIGIIGVLLAKLFADPYNDEVQYTPDSADPATHSNFTDFRKNLAYSCANPYPDANAAAAGYNLTSKLNAAFAVAADLNPGTGKGNSRNHEGRGQNVLYADGHVTWERTTTCGMNGDDIYTNKSGVVQGSPVDATDSILLPAGN